MQKVFADSSAVHQDTISITGDDVNHIVNVLRMKPEEQILVSTGGDSEYLCEIGDRSGETLNLRILDYSASSRELPVNLVLCQAIPKGDRMETVIQKAVELGASRVVPVKTSRVIVKLTEDKLKKRLVRWNAIAESAARQSKRNVIPEVTSPVDFRQAIENAADQGFAIIPYEQEHDMAKTRETIKNIVNQCRTCPGKTISIFIGPEGGFSEEEIDYALSRGVTPVTLGHRILRTETAGMTMLSVLMFMLES